MLVIEIDGLSHYFEGASLKDQIRQQRLESLGVRFLRFSETDMKRDMQNVIRTIEAKIAEILNEDKTVLLPKNFDWEWVK